MATLAIDVLPRESSPGRRAFYRLLHRPSAVLGLVVVAAFVGIALAAPLLAPYDPIATSWSAIRKAPSAAHLFGTDELGRDVFSRVIFGARASLLAGVVSVLISLSIGIPIGLLAGYVGRWTDGVISRVTDAMLATPFLIRAIARGAGCGALARPRRDAPHAVPHSRHRARPISRAESHQRDDRDRLFGDARI